MMMELDSSLNHVYNFQRLYIYIKSDRKKEERSELPRV